MTINKPFMPVYDSKNIPILDDVIERADNKKRDFDLSTGSAEPLDTGPSAGPYAIENNKALFSGKTVDLISEGSDSADPDIEPSVIEVEAKTVTNSIIDHPVIPGTISLAAKHQIGAIDNIKHENNNTRGGTVAGQGISPEMGGCRVTQGAVTEEQSSRSGEAECRDDIALYSPANISEDEAEKFESALIGYKAVDEAVTSTINTPAIDLSSMDKQTYKQPAKVKQQTSTTNSLQSVTDDIVKQLMPKLELQLRLLLKQALKEKLSEDIKQTEIHTASNPDK